MAFVGLGSALFLLLASALGLAALARTPARLRMYLNQPRCACCDYDLQGIRPEPDGCTVCPECSAAWMLPRDEQAEYYQVKPLGLRLRDDRGRCVRISPVRRVLRVLALALAVTGLIAVAHTLAGPVAAGFLYMGAIAVVGVAVMRKGRSRPQRADPVGDLLRMNKCPVCETSLTQQATEPDDCTVCPECGAAWRLPERC